MNAKIVNLDPVQVVRTDVKEPKFRSGITDPEKELLKLEEYEQATKPLDVVNENIETLKGSNYAYLIEYNAGEGNYDYFKFSINQPCQIELVEGGAKIVEL